MHTIDIDVYSHVYTQADREKLDHLQRDRKGERQI